MSDISQLVLYDTVIIDAQPEYDTDGAGHAVLLLSVAFKSGLWSCTDIKKPTNSLCYHNNICITYSEKFKFVILEF